MRYIKQLYLEKDGQAFKALGQTGYCTMKQLKSCGISPTRVKNYRLDGYIEKKEYNFGSKTETAFTLTKQGRDVYEKQFGFSNIYKAQSAQHDTAIAKKYFSLTDEQRESFKTETEIRRELEERIQELKEQEETREQAEEYEKMLFENKISPPDCAYTVVTESGEEIQMAYEVITDNYGKEEIRAKEIACQILNYKLEEEKA